jgi:hypothetical protein
MCIGDRREDRWLWRNRFYLPAVLLALALHAELASSQQLTIQNDSGKQTVLARADIEGLPRVKVPTGAAGASTTYEGSR